MSLLQKCSEKGGKTFLKPFGFFLHDYADRRSDKTECFFSGNAKDTKFDSFICNFSISIKKAGSLSKTVTARSFKNRLIYKLVFVNERLPEFESLSWSLTQTTSTEKCSVSDSVKETTMMRALERSNNRIALC